MTGKEFKDTYMSCIVYIWKRNDEYLYVGSSSHGLRRPLTQHPIINRNNILDTDTVEIVSLPDKESTLAEERRLIKLHTPRYNSIQGRGNHMAKTATEELRNAELTDPKVSRQERLRRKLHKEILEGFAKRNRGFFNG